MTCEQKKFKEIPKTYIGKFIPHSSCDLERREDLLGGSGKGFTCSGRLSPVLGEKKPGLSSLSVIYTKYLDLDTSISGF